MVSLHKVLLQIDLKHYTKIVQAIASGGIFSLPDLIIG